MRIKSLALLSTAVIFIGCAAAGENLALKKAEGTAVETNDYWSVLPRMQAERDAATGTMTVNVVLGRCTSSSYKVAGDTLNVTLDRDARTIHITGYFLFEKATGGVKKDCRRRPTKQFTFENVEPTIFSYSYDTSYSRLFVKQGRSVDFSLQDTDYEPITCDDIDNGTEPIDMNGLWYPEDDPSQEISLRSGEPTSLSWKECPGPMLCGGIIPEFLTSKTPYVFDFESGGRIEFQTSSCAVISQPNSNYQTRLIKHQPHK